MSKVIEVVVAPVNVAGPDRLVVEGRGINMGSYPPGTRFRMEIIEETIWESIPACGDHMTIENWLECVRSGGFIDYDGYGHLATEDQMSNTVISPSDVRCQEIDPQFTHIVWFNR